MADILHLIKINAARERVYQAITTAEGIRQWWTRDVDLDSKAGGHGEFRFAAGTRITKVRIEELKPFFRAVWKPLAAPIPAWLDTKIEFELNAEEDNSTTLRFSQCGFKQTDDLFAMVNTAWAVFLISLKEYLETGKGTPHPGDVLSRAPGSKKDFRLPTATTWQAPRAAVDSGTGTIIAAAEVASSPERLFELFTTPEVERWWGHPDFYRWENWKADLRAGGQWSVTVVFKDGSTNGGSGEFAEIDAPRKLVMTRRFDNHPLQGAREDTITYRFDPVPAGTRVTVRDEGYLGRSAAAYGNAEHWERVLGWLAAYAKTASAA